MSGSKPADVVAAERIKLDELYRAIGRFMFEFSQLGFMIRHALGCALNLDDRRFDIVTASYDFAKLCSVTKVLYIETLGCNEADVKEITNIFSGCIKVNDAVRVPIAHGTWFIDESGMGARHITRASFATDVKFSKTTELDQQSDNFSRLRTRLVKFLIGPVPALPPTPSET